MFKWITASYQEEKFGREKLISKLKQKSMLITATFVLLCMFTNTVIARETEILDNLMIEEKGTSIINSTLGAPINRTVSWTTPGTYTWTVPKGVTSINVTIAGAGGGGGAMAERSHRQNKAYIHHYADGGNGGNGDRQQIKINVNFGETYTVVIGKGGKAGTKAFNKRRSYYCW